MFRLNIGRSKELCTCGCKQVELLGCLRSCWLYIGWELYLDGVETFVVVAHHAEVVCCPDCGEVNKSIAAHPLPVIGHEVVTKEVHVLDLPSEALLVAIVPCAVTSTFFWPDVDHLSSIVEWIGHDTCNAKGDSHVDQFDVVIWESLVEPKEEVLVLVEGEDGAECGPEQPLVQGEWCSSSEQVRWSLLEWNSEKSLCWWFIVSSQLSWPSFVSKVSSPCIFERNDQSTSWSESKDGTIEMLVGVIVGILLWWPCTSIDSLPHGELHSRTSSNGNVREYNPILHQMSILFKVTYFFPSSDQKSGNLKISLKKILYSTLVRGHS